MARRRREPMADASVERAIEDALQIVKTSWTQGASARDVDGRACSALSQGAVKYCANGALVRAAHRNGVSAARLFACVVAVAPDFVRINDGPDGQRWVIAFFEEALENPRA
jgi:hypothetical protein